ncbi:hypothetical protein VE04_06344 [Pseudogymnoascus sp. 24MN13]|nr:hypothetical protein VE04_06344 [Pseudogymnoascus sp. 24MN13]
MAQPSTPASGSVGVFGSAIYSGAGSHAPLGLTPGSAASSTNTFLMPNSPVKPAAKDNYRPKVVRTLGQRPACLVNATVTYCGGNNIYAFGGFDAYTDEVYNHVLKLDMVSHQWSLVDNYGDIPGVRMGHTATLYQGDKLLIFGGENEHRTYLSDLIIFDLKTAHWTQPAVTGPIPKGRARHAAVLHEDKLFIVGGITGHNNYVLDDICYLDLKTFTWSRAWRFVGRFDHQAFIWGDRMWVFGGLSEDAEKVGDIYWLDLKGTPAFDSPPAYDTWDRRVSRQGSTRQSAASSPAPVGSTGYAANSSSAQVNPASFQLNTSPPAAPGAVSSLKFVSGPNIPAQGSGMHFHVFTSGNLLDFVTPAVTIAPADCSLSSLDLDTLRWQKLAEGREIFRSGYRWHYCTMDADGTKAWLLGCPTDPAATDLGPNGFEEYLSDIMEIDLRKYGLLGNDLAKENRADVRTPFTSLSGHSGRSTPQPSRGLGADLAILFNVPPESGSGTDFIVTASREDDDWDDDAAMSSAGSPSGSVLVQNWLAPDASTSQPIHVHKLILQARWPHFARLYNAQMAEFHTKKMHIPEPYPVVKAFLYYLYTDSIHMDDVPELDDVAGLLVLSNIYNIPHLRLLCVNRLSKEMDVEHACVTWTRRPASRPTSGSASARRITVSSTGAASQEIDMEGRVVGGEELEVVGGLGGGRFGVGGASARKFSAGSSATQMQSGEEGEEDDEEMGVS